MAKEKKKKGRAGKVIIFLIFLAIIALAVLCFFGDGFGFGNGSGGFVPADATVAETSGTAETSAVSETNFAEVNISGEEYLYNNSSYSLDDLITELSKIEGVVEVHICLDDTATLAAREALEARLDEEKISRIIVEKTE